ncbi:hypothetical protein LB465_12605 [Salegentibacter sp. LM13S]|uniref:hypothetical protein n=1 Tax=Salegentibacter lacus TaxID=2873599 RepID=UPI001CCC5A20|nr:hypothetical protein [Salegentibacter lacus]MBZ9631623.1 hypothetical protein [Salegentibacter lacus]
MKDSVIVFLDKYQVKAAKWEEEYRTFKNNPISLKSLEDIAEMEKSSIIFSGQKYPKIGSVYITHPFKKSEFVELSTSSQNIQIEKINNFCHICQLLGASEIEANNVITEIKEFEFENKTGLRIPKASINNKIKKKREEANKRVYKLHQTFGENRTPNYAAAYKTYEERLKGDLNIRNLLDSRNPDLAKGNLLSLHKMELTISSELNSLLDIASNLSGVKQVFSLSNEYQQKFRMFEEITLQLIVKF